MRIAKRRLVSLGWLVFVFFLLSGCMLFASPAGDPHPVSPPRSESRETLSPLSEAGQAALLERALASPSVQALIQKLEARGWHREPGAEQALAFARGQILILRFTQKDQGETFPPPLESKWDTKRAVKPSPVLSSSPPFLMYAALPEREEAFAVLKEGEDALLHLYPDGERRFLWFSGAALLEQLRKNGRFRKFELDLKRHVDQVACGPALVDQATNIAYIFVTGCNSSLSPHSLPAVYPPPSSYHPVEGATYLALAKVRSLASSELVIDPESLWLLPHALESGTFKKQGSKETYTVIAGGQRPSAWSDLQSFGWVDVIYPVQLARPEPMSHVGVEPLTGMSLTIFCWELADYPEDNILLRFKTDLELTLELYNKAARYADYGVVGLYDSSQLFLLAGYDKLTPAELHAIQQKPRFVAPPSITFEMLQKLMEDVLGLSLDEVGLIFLRLAEAERQGRFAEEYAAVAHTRLARLRELLFKSPDYFPAHLSIGVSRLPPEAKESRAKEFIRAAALEYARIVRKPELQGLEPQALLPLIIGALKWLAKIILETLASYALEEYVTPYFEGKPLEDVVVLEYVRETVNRSITIFERQRFEDHLNYYKDVGGNLFGHPASYYPSAVSDLLATEDRNVYIVTLTTLLHFTAKVERGTDEWKERMATVLRTVDYLDTAIRLKGAQNPVEAWRPLGLYIDENEKPTVLLKQKVTVRNAYPGRYEERVNLAAVRIHDAPHFSVDHCSEWLEEAKDILYEATLRVFKNEELV
ncbi:MAG: hypothetical protein NZ651_05940, partial [Candidatus Bipolaricaulota bacterium]|nr:hypothetical protein [Candidatus Bipolaricaulota bacterium]MDW8127294.1 hypothetical protein [Candidatus Bipolaricaulota bacterium]